MAPKVSQKLVHADVVRALAIQSEETLLLELETLAQKYPYRWDQGHFGAEAALWGPDLFRRNRVRFRPFIVAHFSAWSQPQGSWAANESALSKWLADADAADDALLFSRLYEWKLGSLKRDKGAEQWRRDLLSRFEDAKTPAQRQGVLQRFAQHYPMKEDDALRLFKSDAKLSAAFILQRLPRHWFFGEEKRTPWTRLMDAARERGVTDLYFRLYRVQTPVDQWKGDAVGLGRTTDDPAALCRELRLRHLEGWNVDRGETLLALLKSRGRDVFPYVRAHLRECFGNSVWGGRKSWYKEALALARERGWWEMHGALVRTCGPAEDFGKAVMELVASSLPDSEAATRLVSLAGVSREWHIPALSMYHVLVLPDKVAVALYERFPDLARGPFRTHIVPGYHMVYPLMRARLIQARDDDFLDHLAAATAQTGGWWSDPKKEFQDEAQAFTVHYESLKVDPLLFTRRAANVLGKIAAYSIHKVERLVEKNALARLLFARSARDFLAAPTAVRDLLESPQIHVQVLGFRVVAMDDPRAREIAVANLDLLLPTLLRPLHRATRLVAFSALSNAGRHSEAVGARILANARMAMDLPDEKYPKEALVSLIGAMLAAWPALRGPRETPRVFAGSAR